jgi:hypothetical protein
MNESIKEYTIKDLINMFKLSIPLNKFEIQSVMDTWLRSDKNNTIVAQRFIKAASNKLLNSLKTPTRHETTTYSYDSHSVLMQLKQPKVNQTYELDSVKDSLNPTFQNTVTRIINLDSKYREGSYPLLDPITGLDVTYDFATNPVNNPSVCLEPDKLSSTEYTAYLSTTLTDVLSLKIYHISIPYLWYNIDEVYGTNVFNYRMSFTNSNSRDENTVTIPSGHYNLTGDKNNIYNVINEKLKPITPYLRFELDPLTRKTKINYYSTDFSGIYTKHNMSFTILWFDIINRKNENTKSNSNLGWKLGFRREVSYINNQEQLDNSGNFNRSGTPACCMDFSGGFSPLGSSIFLEIRGEDNRYYNNDKTISCDTSFIYYKNEPVYKVASNTSITYLSGPHNSPGNIMREYPAVSNVYLNKVYKYTAISEAPADLLLTKYLLLGLEDYNNNQLNSGLISIQSSRSTEQNVNINSRKYGLKVAQCPSGNKNYYQYNTGLSNEITGITKAQLATVNAIAKHKNIPTNKTSPPSDNIFAIIRIPNDIQYGQLITDNNIILLNNQRTYFGPCSIGSFKIKLMTEDGNTLNLNKTDWSFALICKQLYQY